METLQIQIEVEDGVAKAYQEAASDFKVGLNQRLSAWLKQHLQKTDAVNDGQEQAINDPWLDFLDHIDEHAVDTGIEDLSLNHDHYLYGVPKR